MKKFTQMIRALLPVVFAALTVTSCIKDVSVDHPGPERGEGERTVTFAMRVPGTVNPGTRGLAASQEDEVDEVHVIVINKLTGNVFKHEVATPSGAQVGNKRTFQVTLPVGEYHLAVIANADALIRSQYPNGIANGTTMSDVRSKLVLARQQALTDEGDRSGDKWNTTVDASKSYLIPMWGQRSDVTITPTPAVDQDLGTVNLYRMVAKIDVRVPRQQSDGTPIIPATDFEFTAVQFYNYNTKGYVIPEAANGTWENGGGGKASAPSAVPATNNFVNGEKKYQKFTAIDNSYTVPAGDVANEGGLESALIGMIYTFEVGAGSEYNTRPCVLIGGKWKGTKTWYRVDMVAAGTTTHLDLLRNHRYVVWVKSIKGPGYDSPEEAYRSKPINLEATVIPWDEGAFLEGVWNGNNYIKFSTLEARFTQFGEPTPQIVTVKSDMGDLKFNGFTNTHNAGPNDQAWMENPAGTFTNSHFTVVVSGPVQQGSEYIYTCTVTTKETTSVATDPLRHCYFRIVGSNLNATFNIYQEAHLPYMLETTPEHQGLIRVTGAEQAVAINVQSTHEYDIELQGDMFTPECLVYTDASCTNQLLPLTGIDHTTVKTVYVKVKAYAEIAPRAGTIGFTHTSALSDAGASIITVIQMTPMITAELKGGSSKTEGEISKEGGSVTIDVKSNMSAWVPVLSRTVGTASSEDLNGTLVTYFDPANGSANQTVTFTLPAMADGATEDVVYHIHFKDANGATQSSPVIKVTQIAKLPGGGGGGTPPTGGVLAPAGILAVDSNGVLNLDGPARPNNYIVYFRWGSTIAIAGGTNGAAFTSKDIAWTPEAYPFVDLVTAVDGETTPANKWAKIPYQSTGMAIVSDLAAGTGDPCKLAIKGGVVGGWRMPTGNPYEKFLYSTLQTQNLKWKTPNAAANLGYSSVGMLDDVNGQYYPTTGLRNGSTGGLSNVVTTGYYWSASPDGSLIGRYLSFNSGGVNPSNTAGRGFGFAVRCVSE